MLIKELAKEVIESFLPIQTGNYELIEQDLLADLPKFCQLDLRALVEDCHNQLRRRQASVAPVPSPERPPAERFNLLSTNRPTAGSAQAEVTHAEPTETAPLRAAPDQAEFITAVDSASDSASDSAPLAQPAAEPAAPPSRSGVVPLPVPPQPAHQSSYASPVSPLYAANRFTQTRQSDQRAASATPQLQQVAARFRASAAPAPAVNAPTIKTYTIACIDDSQTVLQAINHFLDDKSFSVVLINDPVKALMQIIRSKPDLILLDVTMPNLDGYELCSLLRKHPSFRHTPVIMVTGNTGFIDRAKAKLVGASGYLTKPFNQSDLVKMVFKHLS
jgi:CheY-like chemotaxis protein